MLDCGEGTCSQIERLAHNINQSTRSIYRKLTIVFISHMHADHHLGFVDFLKNWNEANSSSSSTEASEPTESNAATPQLILVAPNRYKTFLSEFNEVDPFFENVKYYQCDKLTKNGDAVEG